MLFKDHEKSAHVRLNEWLEKHPDVFLVDIKPAVLGANFTYIFAILEDQEKKSDRADKPDKPDKAETAVENKEKE